MIFTKEVIKMNKQTVLDLAAQGKRIDNRAFDEYRSPINIQTDISWTAEGSVRVQIGETVVMAGVKLSLEKPYNDTPNEGGMMVNVELTPLSSSRYESGPPSIKAIEMARVIDRGIREAGAIDVKKLCVKPGEKAWFVIVDVVTINDAGNMFDSIGLAVLAALKDARFPEVDEETGSVNYKKKTDVSLPILREPISITVYKVNGQLLVDPIVEEEDVYEARLTVATDKDGVVSAMQKGGNGPLTLEEIEKMVSIALEKAKMLREKLD